MNSRTNSWDPRSSDSWGRLLGLVPLPMFGYANSQQIKGEHAILLDGRRASFAFSRSDDEDLLRSDEPLSWSWSSNVRHSLIVLPKDSMLLRHWDSADRVKLPLPRRGQDAIGLFQAMEQWPAPRTPDVIQFVLRGFRLIRDALGDDSLRAIQVLNGFLLAAHGEREGDIDEQALLKARTFGDVLGILEGWRQELAQVGDMPSSVRQQELGVIMQNLVGAEPLSQCRLYPDLLFRHAASRLYQEAHLEIERKQLSFPGMGPVDEPKGKLPRDVRFTPANLARALVEQALGCLGDLAGRVQPLVVLDPACGSGIFLSECLHELAHMQFPGSVRVVGYDKMPISKCITDFCLNLAKRDLSGCAMKIDTTVHERDSLNQQDWESADLILMNPPFIALDGLKKEDELDAVLTELGHSATGRVDIAMAFVHKAIRHLKPGGALASVLPASLLDTRSGQTWREAIEQDCDLVLVGRFEGYKYFPSSLVETAFVLLQRKPKESPGTPRPVQIVIADEGAEDAALRGLRLPEQEATGKPAHVDIFELPKTDFDRDSWRPVRQSVHEIRKQLSSRGMPTVKDLFTVRQGIRTGGNKAFLLTAEQYNRLPDAEKDFFRPGAGQGTLYKGRLHPYEYVFYPYKPSELLLTSEEELRQSVPEYFDTYLAPHKAKLSSRPRIQHWWELTRKRKWQVQRFPMLVSTYFGAAGSFAYDETGDYAVVQGYAWLWKKKMAHPGAKDLQAEVHRSPMPWAYLALLNSPLFERLLGCFCPRVQGGQFNLSKRFVKDIPIPNLADMGGPAAGALKDLARLGRQIHQGQWHEIQEPLNTAASRAYSLPTDFGSI